MKSLTKRKQKPQLQRRNRKCRLEAYNETKERKRGVSSHFSVT